MYATSIYQKIIGVLILTFLFSPLYSFGIEIYEPSEAITIGEFIYNDDYTPTTDDCTITITDPTGSVLVNNVTMSDRADGWHYYNYTLTSTEGKWSAFISCGAVISGDLLKIDKSFIVKAPVVTDSSVATSVWSNVGRTLTSGVSIASDIWSAATRTLTGATLDSGSLALTSDITTASSSIAAVVNNNTNSIVTTASSSLGAAITAGTTAVNSNTNSSLDTASSSLASVINANTNLIVGNASTSLGSTLAALPASVWNTLSSALTTPGSVGKQLVDNVDATISSRSTSGAASWEVRMSDIERVQTGKVYRSKIFIFNEEAVATTPFATPTIRLYDADRNLVVSNVPLSLISTGIYEYTYTVSSGASQGLWEAIVSSEVESGKIVQTNDYFEVAGSPAQVIINNVDASVPGNIIGNITITNEGLAGYEYQYEWCVVSDINNDCGDGDDEFYSLAAKYINPGDSWNTALTASVSTVGTHYFKLVVYFGTESSTASRVFTISPSSGGGGGGGGSTSSVSTRPTVNPVTAEFTDINLDGRVDTIDFSIMLAYWNALPPYNNPRVDINKDKKVNTIDFSILLYYWGKTGLR